MLSRLFNIFHKTFFFKYTWMIIGFISLRRFSAFRVHNNFTDMITEDFALPSADLSACGFTRIYEILGGSVEHPQEVNPQDT